MSKLFEEIDYRLTPMGPVSLRRRWLAGLEREVVEVMLGDEHLMSSLFTEGEIALTRLGLAKAEGEGLRVLVGGLGLGYTARAALEDPRVAHVEVVEAVEAVIDWHREGLVPIGDSLGDNPACTPTLGSFFDRAHAFPDAGEAFDAILLDIDHSPGRLLHPDHAGFYTAEGLGRCAAGLTPGGVFALWSDDPPEEGFLAAMRSAFADVEAEVVTFANPVTGGESTCTIYLGRKA